MDKNGFGQTVVKADLVEQVYKKVGFTRQEAVEAVEVLFYEIKKALAQGENVRITRFASFNLRNKKARKARNPKTGEPIEIRSRKVLTFKPSKELLMATNNSGNDRDDS